MRDGDYDALEAKVRGFCEKWIDGARLGLWRVAIEFHRDSYKGSGTGDVDPRGDGLGAAHCKADWRYMHATIEFNMPELSDKDDHELEMIVVHEVAHILINEMRWWDKDHGIDHEERVASHLAKVFMWVTR